MLHPVGQSGYHQGHQIGVRIRNAIVSGVMELIRSQRARAQLDEFRTACIIGMLVVSLSSFRKRRRSAAATQLFTGRLEPTHGLAEGLVNGYCPGMKVQGPKLFLCGAGIHDAVSGRRPADLSGWRR